VGSLRVIAGLARGQKLHTVPGTVTRPITDRVKESLFNIIGNDIQGAIFLDIFAGTGAVSVEAISRGALWARLIDQYAPAVKTINANLKHTRLADHAEVLQMDAFAHLSAVPDRSFDYVYIAPPQYKDLWQRALQKIDQSPTWLNEHAWVIVQIDPVEYETVALINLEEFDQRRYGSTLLVFYIAPGS
jgi:16S rRNA (guanine(966)-N(2))-methyltransferase RsmD